MKVRLHSGAEVEIGERDYHELSPETKARLRSLLAPLRTRLATRHPYADRGDGCCRACGEMQQQHTNP